VGLRLVPVDYTARPSRLFLFGCTNPQHACSSVLLISRLHLLRTNASSLLNPLTGNIIYRKWCTFHRKTLLTNKILMYFHGYGRELFVNK